MSLIHTVLIVNLLVVANGLSPIDKFSSSVEALLNGRNELCLGDCTGWKGKEECVYDWDGNVARCTILMDLDNVKPKRTRKYRTIHNEVCYSNCGKYNENHDWCVTNLNNVLDRNFCTRKIALKGVQTYRTKDKYLTCNDACTKRSNSSNWCHTVKEWQYCDPSKKVIVFNFLSENGKECVTPCDLHYGIPHCFNTDGAWKKCYLNPDFSEELSQMSENINETRAPGVYTLQGYRKCKKMDTNDLLSKNPLNIEEIARQYEENFPTVDIRYLDPKYLITDDPNPVLSYTVYNTFSHFSDKQVNLPLVIRAVITNHTIQRDFNDEIKNQYNEMFPIDVRDKYDERGNLLPSKLGGPIETYNIFPQSWRHKQGPLSGWCYMETDIYNFLNKNMNSYAEYIVVVTYNLKDGDRPYRPTAVGVRVRFYKDVKNGVVGSRQLCDVNGKPITFKLNQLDSMFFTNDPNFNCIIDATDKTV